MLQALTSVKGWTVQRIVRVCIAGYFLAIVFGFAPGTDMSFILGSFLPTETAALLADAILATLAISILMGWHRAFATMTLAGLLFVASYIELSAHFALTGHVHAEAVSNFWLDFGLIVLLLLTYSDGDIDVPKMKSPAVSSAPVRPKPETEETAPVKPLSRGQVQRGYHVGPTGRAVSRQLKDDPKRRDTGPVAKTG